MREILFRGKRATGDWVKGFYVQKPNPFSEDGQPIRHCIVDLPPFGYDVDPETIGQFTGRYDKNGEKVYEGDVLSLIGGEYRGVVMWSDHDQCYFISPNWDNHTTIGDFGDFGRADYYEIVGNIHDNPELLKGGGEE